MKIQLFCKALRCQGSPGSLCDDPVSNNALQGIGKSRPKPVFEGKTKCKTDKNYKNDVYKYLNAYHDKECPFPRKQK